METVDINMIMEQHTKEAGLKTNSKETELRHGQTEQDMREDIKKVKRVGKVNYYLQMGVSMKATL